MNFKKVLNEAPMNMTSDSLRVWNIEQMKVWEKVKNKYNFMDFAKKFDELFNSTFSKEGKFPSIEKMVEKF